MNRSIARPASSLGAAAPRARRLRRLPMTGRVEDRHELSSSSSTGSGKGGDLGGLAGADRLCTSLASAAGAGNRTWRAYLSTQAAAGAPAVNARDRIGNGPVAQRQGRGHRPERRRAARRQQHQQADGAHRDGRGRQRPRRHAEHARHPDRLAARRHGHRRQRRHHLRQLDQERRRRGDGRPPRPHRPRRERAGEVVELLAPVARLQPRGAEGHRRRRAASTASPPTERRAMPVFSSPRHRPRCRRTGGSRACASTGPSG